MHYNLINTSDFDNPALNDNSHGNLNFFLLQFMHDSHTLVTILMPKRQLITHTARVIHSRTFFLRANLVESISVIATTNPSTPTN